MEEKQIVNILKLELKSKKITYKDLGREMGLSENTIAKILNGNTTLTLKRLREMMSIAGVKCEIKINNTTVEL